MNDKNSEIDCWGFQRTESSFAMQEKGGVVTYKDWEQEQVTAL